MGMALLRITDGTTAVNLLSTISGARLVSWRPQRPQFRDDGVWQESPLADGRRLLQTNYDNTIDTFTIHILAYSQDHLAEFAQDLDRLLLKAVAYWTSDWQTTPVYIEARGTDETETRYATIMSYSFVEEGDPYAQATVTNMIRRGWTDLDLLIEHGMWQETVPGAADCIEISAMQEYNGCWFGHGADGTCDAIGGSTGFLLQEDGVSYILQEDGASKIELEPVPLEVYVANKHNRANLTHVFWSDVSAGTFGSNLITCQCAGEDAACLPDLTTMALLYVPFDGPTPYSTSFTGSVHGWMGEVGTMVGGVIHRPGYLCKAVQCAAARTNMVLNPTSGAAGNWAAMGAATVTPNDATYAYVGTTATKVITTAAANDGVSATLSALTNADHYATAMLYGTFPTATHEWSLNNATWHTPVLLGTDETWSLYGYAFPAAEANGSTHLYMRQNDATVRTWYVDAVQVELGTYPTPSIDGTMGTGHAWTGAANASTSTRTAAHVTYPVTGNLLDTAGSIAAWVWVEAPTPATGSYVFYAAGAVAGTITLSITPALALSGSWGTTVYSGGVLTACAWHHVAVTFDGTDLALYVDGALAAGGAEAGFNTLPGTMHIGANATPAGWVNGRIDDLVILSAAMAADDVAALWLAGAPVAPTDAGLFPTPVQDHDACYFGCDTSVTDSGPFCSLVFDLLTPAVYTGDGTLVWEYWNGAWTAFGAAPDTLDDNTVMLSEPGVTSTGWHAPVDWVTTAVNGTTAYWVRARFDTPGGAGTMTQPVQQHRPVYSVVWPCVEVVADDVGGDVPLLARIQVECAHDDWMFYVLHAAVRSLSRGEDFTPYLLAADEQNPAGVTVTPQAAGVGTVQAQVDAPAGRAVRFLNLPAATTDYVTFSLDDNLCPQWEGTYHAFARCWQTAGTTSKVRLYLTTGTRDAGAAFTALWQGGYSAYITPNLVTAGNHSLIDLGRITLPPGQPGMGYNLVDVRLNVQNTDAGNVTVWVSDLILMPVDEWSGTFYPTAAGVTEGHFADLDSVTSQRTLVHAAVRSVSNENVLAPLQAIVNGAVQLQANAAQRVWFLFQGGASPYRYAYVSTLAAVRLFGVSRYLGSRGAR
jgi:hypothetical protein